MTLGEMVMKPAAVRTTVLSGWMDRFAEFGVNPATALAVAGIDSRISPSNCDSIPLANFTQMAEYVGNTASNPAVSWLIGENYDLAELGEVGIAITSAKTLGGALRRMADNFELLQDSSRLSIEITADAAIISYRILDPSIWPRYHDALFSLGIITKIVKMSAPNAMDSMELGFECGKRETGLHIGQTQMSFECEANSIRIPVSFLDRAMPVTGLGIGPVTGLGIGPDIGLGPKLPAGLRSLSSALAEKRRSQSACERLAGIIFGRLSDGDINQDCLASEIGMSSRTMRRRLADEATSFQQLLDDCRMRQAVLEFQMRPCASIADIALRLGYAEHSTFTRAFSRWAGMPPQRYRAAMNHTKH
jgi:AraC-like DNA-binding protein